MKITAHPDAAKLAERLKALGTGHDAPFDGELFRFINPTYSKSADVIDGAGALHANGRWNLKGAARLSCTALAPQTALAEALAHVQYFRLPLSKALPRVLVALRLKAKRVLDLRHGNVRKALRLSEDTIRKLDWRAANQHGDEAVTQAWGSAFAAAGFEAVIVPSAADAPGANVLVFPENLQAGSRFEVVSEVKWPGK
jgi:RES domain-containing protein